MPSWRPRATDIVALIARDERGDDKIAGRNCPKPGTSTGTIVRDGARSFDRRHGLARHWPVALAKRSAARWRVARAAGPGRADRSILRAHACSGFRRRHQFALSRY